MHIADGILNAPMMAGTGVLAVSGVALGLRSMDYDQIPRVAMVSAVYFMASLMRIPMGPASTHLVLTGLTGLLLGWAAFPAAGAALLLQAVLFGFGGLTSWGANVLNAALPAVLCYYVFGSGIRRTSSPRVAFFLAAAAGSAGVLLSSLMLAGTLYLCGNEFVGAGTAILLSHLPVVLVEGVVTGVVVLFFFRAHPGMLRGSRAAMLVFEDIFKARWLAGLDPRVRVVCAFVFAVLICLCDRPRVLAWGLVASALLLCISGVRRGVRFVDWRR